MLDHEGEVSKINRNFGNCLLFNTASYFIVLKYWAQPQYELYIVQ